jgi:hypothetical protein
VLLLIVSAVGIVPQRFSQSYHLTQSCRGSVGGATLKGMTLDEDDDLTRRAFAAYFRSGGTDQPANYSGVREHKGLRYVVLENVNGTLAVYRIRRDEVLKGLRRWPSAVAAA